MKAIRLLFVILTVFQVIPLTAAADDFDWMRGFNIRAEADPSGLQARLEARFKVGETMIETVLGNVERPALTTMLSASIKKVRTREGECLRKVWE